MQPDSTGIPEGEERRREGIFVVWVFMIFS